MKVLDLITRWILIPGMLATLAYGVRETWRASKD